MDTKSEQIIKSLEEKLLIQTKEIEEIKRELKYKNSSEPCRGRFPHRGQWRGRGYRRGHDFRDQGRGQQQHQNLFQYSSTEHPEGFYEERVTERIFYPASSSVGNGRGFFKGSAAFPQSFVPDSYLRPEHPSGQSERGFKQRGEKAKFRPQSYKHKAVPVEIPESVLRARCNTLPFVVEEPMGSQREGPSHTCDSCLRMIGRHELLVSHAEPMAYPHHRHGWMQPITSREAVTVRYHLRLTCLIGRGLSKEYLAVCHVLSVSAPSSTLQRSLENCGFFRRVVQQPEVLDHQEKKRGAQKQVTENSFPGINNPVSKAKPIDTDTSVGGAVTMDTVVNTKVTIVTVSNNEADVMGSLLGVTNPPAMTTEPSNHESDETGSFEELDMDNFDECLNE